MGNRCECVESHILKQWQECIPDVSAYRNLICFTSSQIPPTTDKNEWVHILRNIIEVLATNSATGGKQILLASHAFFGLLSTQYTLNSFKKISTHLLNSDEVYFLDKEYILCKPELFKLIVAYGYLQVNHKEVYDKNIYLTIFNIVYRNCIKYTKYSYFGYKVLLVWLHKSMNTSFWKTNDICIENQLETVIFTNWCNAINEISKQNAASVFNMYLQIMNQKYVNFLEFAFESCVNNLSWQNEIKYIILAEICNIWNNIQILTAEKFLLSLCTSLTQRQLHYPGTKVYINIMKKLEMNAWMASFGSVFKIIINRWDSELNSNHNALQVFCKHWLEPSIKKYKNVMDFLWTLSENVNGYYFRSCLVRIAKEMHFELDHDINIKLYLNHEEEAVRLNGFAVCCNEVCQLIKSNKNDPFFAVKQFLWYNANAQTQFMREGIIKYFYVFFENILKHCENHTACDENIYLVISWLHEFCIDCFEIGCCYQRKILGLSIYSTILSFDNNHTHKMSTNKNSSRYTKSVEKLKKRGIWKFTDKKSLFSLLRLLPDTATDIRQKATDIILASFERDMLTASEKEVLFCMGLQYCNSYKFYETDTGCAFMTILAHWQSLSDGNITNLLNASKRYENYNLPNTYSEFLLNEAWYQLAAIKQDILKATVQNTPFYGVLAAILKIAFQRGAESDNLTIKFAMELLQLLQDAVDFFLSVLSWKSTPTDCSPSFEEMGLAINHSIVSSEIGDLDYDELTLSPAHQIIQSCIWHSLKVSCEMASEIGMTMYSNGIVMLSSNLIILVLTKCRHKGAIDSAGTALSNLTRTLCNTPKYSCVPEKYLLNLCMEKPQNILNITRRGAGLSIMFHQIVVSDNRRGRPLLHLAVKKLLTFLKESWRSKFHSRNQAYDSPVARYLHFLRALVTDKEIQTELISYMESITLICFKYLQSEIWTIRNASLQLFGGIVPRLVGQCNHNRQLDFGNGYTINHFITHYPLVANHILDSLQKFTQLSEKAITQLHVYSNIIHILVLLSKLSTGGCNFTDYSSSLFVITVKKKLLMFLGNPISFIRFAAAKAYAALTAFPFITSEIDKLSREMFSISESNLMHGYLLVVEHLKIKFSIEAEHFSLHDIAKQYVNYNPLKGNQTFNAFVHFALNTKQIRELSYFLRGMLLRTSEFKLWQMNTSVFDKIIPKQGDMLYLEKTEPGFCDFLNTVVRCYASYVKRTDHIDLEILSKILDFPCIEYTVEFLNALSHFLPILDIILEQLSLSLNKQSVLLIDAMINFVVNTLKQSLTNKDKMQIKKTAQNLIETERNSIPHAKFFYLKNVLVILFSENNDSIGTVVSYIFDICNSKEEHLRLKAAEYLELLLQRFHMLTRESRLLITQCCLILLKDELSENKMDIAHYIQIYIFSTKSVNIFFWKHDEIVYHELLIYMFYNFNNLSFNEYMDFINKFSPVTYINISMPIVSPFEHDDQPFYREESKFLNAFCLCYQHLKNCESFDDKNTLDMSIAMKVKYQLQEKSKVNFNRIASLLSLKDTEYLLEKRRIVAEQCNIMQEYAQCDKDNVSTHCK